MFISAQQVIDIIRSIPESFTAQDAVKIVRKTYPSVNRRAIDIYISSMCDDGQLSHGANGWYMNI